MKKLLAALLCFALCLVVSAALAEQTEWRPYAVEDSYDYVLLDDGTAKITKYKGLDAVLTLPSELDGHRVTAIGDNAFDMSYSVYGMDDTPVEITIPDCITAIEGNPFVGCYDLARLVVSDFHPTFASIDGVLFGRADKRLIACPRGYAASAYSVPQGTVAIGESAFSGCDKLEAITLPESVTFIDDRAFTQCDSLTEITIPNSVTGMGVNPFIGCDDLMTINVRADHPAFATIDGVLFSKADKRLISYPCALTDSEYAVPRGIEIIGDGAFSNCKSLRTVTFPNSVKSIGADAFSFCAELRKIYIPKGVTAISDRTFYGCGSLTKVTIPSTVVSIGSEAFSTCTDLEEIAIPSGVTAIGDQAFYFCQDLAKVSIPETVVSIGREAFSYCAVLEEVFIPDGVTSIGDRAFSDCRSLTKVTVPDSVTNIGDGAFDNCPRLTEIVIGQDSYASHYCIYHNLPHTYADANG